jgi:hypothetical protein
MSMARGKELFLLRMHRALRFPGFGFQLAPVAGAGFGPVQVKLNGGQVFARSGQIGIVW